MEGQGLAAVTTSLWNNLPSHIEKVDDVMSVVSRG